MNFKKFFKDIPRRLRGEPLVAKDSMTKIFDLDDFEDLDTLKLSNLKSEIYDSKCDNCGTEINSADTICPICAQFTTKGEEELLRYLSEESEEAL